MQSDDKPGRKPLDPAIAEALLVEVALLDHKKQRTYGTQQIYEQFDGLISRRQLGQAIREARRRQNTHERATATRYEFVAPNVSWSTDFIKVVVGRVMRIDDDFARCSLVWEHRESWSENLTAPLAHAAMVKYGKPCAFKFDMGSEFSSNLFLAMLRGARVMALPNPPWYPRYNGKQERKNGSVRQWLLPMQTARELPTLEQVLARMHDAILDNNQVRTKEVLGHRRPQDVYLDTPRLQIDRNRMYARYEELVAKLMERSMSERVGSDRLRELHAMRLACLTVLQEYKLVRYSCGSDTREGPKVST